MQEDKIKITGYQLIWIFIIGSIFGFIVEIIWHVIKWGTFQYNQGLLYGPFQQIYGFAIVLIVMLGYLLRNKSKLFIFIAGAIGFGFFELVSGWIVSLSGTYSWDYAKVGYSLVIAKYVYIPYCIAWGLFAVIWVTWLYKPLLKFTMKLTEKKSMKTISVIIAVLLSINITLTVLAVNRKVERYNNVEARNGFDNFLDINYDDEFLQKWMPKIRIEK